jgi:uncharacterized protein involved in exopolysaccharide biosynthesis
MTEFSTPASTIHQPPEDEINVLGVLLVFARHIRMIMCVTLIVAIISIAVGMRRPAVYTSSAKLMVLEYVDQSKLWRIGNDGKLIYEKKEGVWKPADGTTIKSIIESAHINSALANRHKLTSGSNPELAQYTIRTKLTGNAFITVTVESNNQNTTKEMAAATVEEATGLAFRMGLVSSPVPTLDEKLEISSGATMVVRLLEPATTGVKVASRRALKVILSTATAFIGSIILAFVIEYFRNMSEEGRRRLADVRAVLKGQNRPSKRSN